MAYLGSTPTTQSFIAGTDYFNGTGAQVAFTLSRSVNSVNDIEVVVNNVEQSPAGYTAAGTTLTFSAAPSSGTANVYVRYLSTTLQSITPSQGSVIPSSLSTGGPYWNTSGSVGIGTSSPSQPLDVRGRIQVSNGSLGGQLGVNGGGLAISSIGVAPILFQGNTFATDFGSFDSNANFKFNSGYGSVATAYGCRAWVNFNGTGTVAIRASGNVSSITDNGVGDYTVNFATAMSDANFATTGSPGDNGGYTCTPYSQTASTVRLTTRISASGAVADISQIHISIFR